MFDEYFRGLQRPNTPQKTFRIKLFLFEAEAMDFALEAIPGFSAEEIRQLELGIQRCAQASAGQHRLALVSCIPSAMITQHLLVNESSK